MFIAILIHYNKIFLRQIFFRRYEELYTFVKFKFLVNIYLTMYLNLTECVH